MLDAARDVMIQQLLDKEAIREVLWQYCRAIDRLDADLLRSVYWPDAYDDHMGMEFTGENVGELLTKAMRDTMDITTHGITTVNIALDGNFAGSESYSTSVHRHTVNGEQKTMFTITRYIDRFERRAGEWRIIHRVVLVDLTGHLGHEHFDVKTKGRRDRSDPSYVVLG